MSRPRFCPLSDLSPRSLQQAEDFVACTYERVVKSMWRVRDCVGSTKRDYPDPPGKPLPVRGVDQPRF